MCQRQFREVYSGIEEKKAACMKGRHQNLYMSDVMGCWPRLGLGLVWAFMCLSALIYDFVFSHVVMVSLLDRLGVR
ncbi:hypothetical protein BDV28DRAFT_144267 [Aspergillus coremiiformis]|uniref:Uncharacterized protein n=1 Tax=Aspergillus coremiiformis TaxID=138285 RepID=A0A5N6YRK5_9EURO|nr:hypothetical protein BDV28DRAFT_144267 [Aspergillus coremiiformis]